MLSWLQFSWNGSGRGISCLHASFAAVGRLATVKCKDKVFTPQPNHHHGVFVESSAEGLRETAA